MKTAEIIVKKLAFSYLKGNFFLKRFDVIYNCIYYFIFFSDEAWGQEQFYEENTVQKCVFSKCKYQLGHGSSNADIDVFLYCDTCGFSPIHVACNDGNDDYTCANCKTEFKLQADDETKAKLLSALQQIESDEKKIQAMLIENKKILKEKNELETIVKKQKIDEVKFQEIFTENKKLLENNRELQLNVEKNKFEGGKYQEISNENKNLHEKIRELKLITQKQKKEIDQMKEKLLSAVEQNESNENKIQEMLLQNENLSKKISELENDIKKQKNDEKLVQKILTENKNLLEKKHELELVVEQQISDIKQFEEALKENECLNTTILDLREKNATLERSLVQAQTYCVCNDDTLKDDYVECSNSQVL